jgi:hypothetical protein
MFHRIQAIKTSESLNMLFILSLLSPLQYDAYTLQIFHMISFIYNISNEPLSFINCSLATTKTRINEKYGFEEHNYSFIMILKWSVGRGVSAGGRE